MIVKTAVAAVVVLVVGACLVAPIAIAARPAGACTTVPAGDGGSLDEEQRANLGAVLDVGARTGVGRAGQIIGVMTALTESSLRNLDHGDQAGPDSRGLFQQRTGWGPLKVRMDPRGASRLFFMALANTPGWASMEPWEAAQAVQRSAFSDGGNYRRNYDLATRLVSAAPGGCEGWPVVESGALPGAEAAVSRALALVGSDGYYQLCARLAANIWGLAQSGYTSAAEQWTQMVATGNAHPNDRQPPTGALLFWATGGPYGHVAVYVGDGRIVSNDIEDRALGIGGVYLVEVGAIEAGWSATYLGWSPPIYSGA
ncbi:CHAP domain-containing protein [Kribbella sp. VKM Ac-2527]|uniref:CHAP domain-containing protein n=1 Tax=Kribbella caucasensis TaxID=2512215 RepID=A0A4R6J5B3_9ACTN|nr:CHAP domain-containing protein [Kribbella sp. VKM Ac-2527]TDO30207.1 CHAP domain-containing protein [Kribbella sp. VKM Ac-2527]